ncbi:hypothetical protein [Staphylococcus saprophyticus]|uniref:hypothetical protein n=1 Tax=Staphylococcus saprophyticus TaxID=29385 RepID=UPI0022EA4CEC|nr:hypothetical protein [Staphylococcus saprophyticus]
MIENKESFTLLYQAISELAAEMGDNQFETKSINLIFLDLDIEHEYFDKLFLAFIQYVSRHKGEAISYKNLLVDKMPRDLSLHIKHKIIIGFANNYLPELKPIADDIKSAIFNQVNKQIDLE